MTGIFSLLIFTINLLDKDYSNQLKLELLWLLLCCVYILLFCSAQNVFRSFIPIGHSFIHN